MEIKKRFNYGSKILEIGPGSGADYLGNYFNTAGIDLSF